MTAPTKPIRLTGAAGNLGRHLAAALAALGWRLRLTDIARSGSAAAGASFVKADITTGRLLRQAEGCAAILHFGGMSGTALRGSARPTSAAFTTL